MCIYLKILKVILSMFQQLVVLVELLEQDLGALLGDTGSDRGTGGGAASAAVNNSNQHPHGGGTGTSYSGGTGGGTLHNGASGSANGGSGGFGWRRWCWKSLW